MTYEESNAAIFSILLSGFKTQAAIIIGYDPTIYWPFQTRPQNAPVDKIWLRVSRKTVLETQAGPASGETINGSRSLRRFDVDAMLFVQLFVPTNTREADKLIPQISQLIKDSLQGKASADNWLHVGDTTIDEQTNEQNWFRVGVSSEFKYQELKEV